MPDVHVFIDGLSLYYQGLRGTPYRWLDPRGLADAMLGNDEIMGIDHYAAPSMREDRGGPRGFGNHMLYLEALATLPEVRIQLVPPDDPVTALAEDMLSRAEVVGTRACSFIISEDTRLAEPIARAKERYNHRCGVGIPSGGYFASLFEAAAFYKRVRVSMLKASLLPDPVGSARGPLHKPAGW